MRTLILFFIVSNSWATITVCASGCDDTTINSAIQTATATPNSVIQLNDSSITNEGVSFNPVNTGLCIQGINQFVTWGNTSSTNAVSINSTLASPITFQNFTLNLPLTNFLRWQTANSNARVVLSGLNDYSTTSTSTVAFAIITPNIGVASGSLSILNCFVTISGNNGNFLYSLTSDTVANSIYVQNCYASCSYGIRLIPSTTNNVASVIASTFLNFTSYGNVLTLNSPASIVDCIFINNNGAAGSLGANANTSLITYTALPMANPGGYGIGCVFNSSFKNTFCDRNWGYLSPGSLSVGTGVSITGITESNLGLNGILHGANWGLEDMGCMPYSAALCGGYNCGK